MPNSTRWAFWLVLSCLWRGQLLSILPSVGSTSARGITKGDASSIETFNGIRECSKTPEESKNISPSASHSSEPAETINNPRKTQYASDPQATFLLSDILGKKRDSERVWKQPWTCLRNAFISLNKKTKEFFSRIKEFLWGSDSESDCSTKIRYGVPKEEDERKEIVQNFIGAIKPGTIAPAWFKNLEFSFRTLPAITEWDRRTQSLLSSLVYALATQSLSLQQRAVILSAINHITSYNPQAKQVLIECANIEPLVFKTLALSIKDVRKKGLPDVRLKHSFEAQWLSTSPEVEEKYWRLLLVDPNGSPLSDQVKEIGERLEHCKDVYTWTEVEKGTKVIRDGEIKTVMNDAMELLKVLSDMEDKLYVYSLIRYIAMINHDALEAWKKKLTEEDFRTSVVKILFILYTPRLMDNITPNSLERKLLFSDAEAGPLLERTALHLYISSLQPAEHIRVLTNRILAPDLHLTGFPRIPNDPKAAHAVLRELIDLAAPKKGEPNLSAWEKDIVMRLLAYLNRWNKYITREILECLNKNPQFLKFMATEVVKKYPDGAHETAPKFSFEHDILKPRYVTELFGRYELKLSTSKISAPELLVASTSLKLLPTRWYDDPLSQKPQEIVRALLKFLKKRPEQDEDYQAKTAIRMLQHFVYFQPSLKELILVAIAHPQSGSLHFHLKKYCETAQHYSNKKGGYTSLFVDWLKEIPMLKDSNRSRNDQFSAFNFFQPSYLIGRIKQRFSRIHGGLRFPHRIIDQNLIEWRTLLYSLLVGGNKRANLPSG